MWLSNYYKMRFADAIMWASNGSLPTGVAIGVIDCNGNNVAQHRGGIESRVDSSISSNIISQTASVSITQVYNYFHIGSGNTAVKDDDFKLESEITTGFSLSGVPVQVDTENNTVKRAIMITNTSNSDTLTIKEFGLTIPSKVADNGSDSVPQVLIYREVLLTPISLAPAETAKFIITNSY